MKIAVVIVFVVALCSHLGLVSCEFSWFKSATTPGPVIPGVLTTLSTTSTTATPWTTKFKDGLGKFFRGAAAVGAVSTAIQNARNQNHQHHNTPKHTPLTHASQKKH